MVFTGKDRSMHETQVLVHLFLGGNFMKKNWLKVNTLLAAIIIMITALTACGGGDNPFLGAWDDDENEQSFIFNDDGTGAQTSYSGAIEFTYTWDGDTATITSEELGISAEVTLEDGVLYTDYSSFVKVDEAEYVPENLDEDDSEEGYGGDSEDTGDSDTELDFWLGEYANDNGTLTIENSGGTLYYALSYIGEDGASVASGTLSESGDPHVLEESDFIFSYDESDHSIEVALQDDAGDYEHYTGWYYYVGPVGGSDASEGDETLDVDAPDSIEAWYGEYEGDAGTLSITDSLEDMVDFTLEANDGSYMSGTWTVSDAGLGVMEDRELYAIYRAEDGSIEITGKTEADTENNASFVGVYHPAQ